MLGESYRISLGGRQGCTEREALDTFKTFTADEVASVLDPAFSDGYSMDFAVDPRFESDYLRFFDHLKGRNEAVRALARIIDFGLEEGQLFQAFKDRFAKMLGIPEHDPDYNEFYVPEIDFVRRAAQLGLAGAFTPFAEREEVFSDDVLRDELTGLQQYQARQIVSGVPDLSKITQKDDVITVVGNELFGDRQTALQSAIDHYGVFEREFRAMDPTNPFFGEIHRTIIESYLGRSVYGAIIDHANGGENNAFKQNTEVRAIEVEPGIVLSSTERGRCPGEPFVEVTLQALGKSIRNNASLITDAIT